MVTLRTRPRALLGLLLSAALLPLLSGCATPALQLPDELAPAERLEVQGMRWWGTPRELRFGSYHATEIDRSFSRGSGWGVAGVQTSKARQSYRFRFADGDLHQGRCPARPRPSGGPWT